MSGIGKFTVAEGRGRRSSQGRKTGWRAELQDLVNKHAGHRVDGRVASFRTRDITAETLFSAFKTLHEEIGMHPQPRNLNEEHIRRLVQHWFYVREKRINTIKTELSILRKFAQWIRKPSMVKPLNVYLPDVPAGDLVVKAAASKSKAWTTNGIDVEEKIEQAFLLNERFGLILLTQLTYGLRLQEALCLRPWKAHDHDGLNIFPNAGSKGGRPRHIPFLIPEQYIIMKEVIKKRIKKGQTLGWEKTRRGKVATLKYNIDNYYAYCREIGITKKDAEVVGHGLRAEFCVNMARVKGFDPETEEYTGENPPWDDLMGKIAEISELVGHSRVQVMASYFGAFKRDRNNDVEYTGLGRHVCSKSSKRNDDGDYASTSAKRSVVTASGGPAGNPEPPAGDERTSNETVSSASPTVQDNGPAPRNTRPSIASLVARFKAPEYRGRGRVEAARKGGGATSASVADGNTTQRPEERQLKLQFPFAVVPRKRSAPDAGG